MRSQLFVPPRFTALMHEYEHAPMATCSIANAMASMLDIEDGCEPHGLVLAPAIRSLSIWLDQDCDSVERHYVHTLLRFVLERQRHRVDMARFVWSFDVDEFLAGLRF